MKQCSIILLIIHYIKHYNVYYSYACSIPDPSSATVLVTGGEYIRNIVWIRVERCNDSRPSS